ncbi:MAG: TIGR03759 family integrating conjugative element protein [Gammaproteobacteria bacterium]|nr:TIGR03759 family integrating conjugative element protein [Gammaproteobacteria bacterium]
MGIDSRLKRCARWVVGCSLFVAVSVMADSEPVPTQQQSTVQSLELSTTEHLDPNISRTEQWDLNDGEWQRYQSLMQGIRGSISPATLSPIEVLGIHARNNEERRRYAEQWAMMMREDAERILAFQHAYDEAQKRLFPNSVLIDSRALTPKASPRDLAEDLSWQPIDRVLFFTDTQCTPCDAVLERLVSQLEQFAGIDLYLVDVAAGEESRIREWAASKQINPTWVSEQRVTLNIDAGALDKVLTHTGQQSTTLPVLVLWRGDQLTPLPVSRF